ncbi:unnamed protein product [Cunninghamella echinulata]
MERATSSTKDPKNSTEATYIIILWKLASQSLHTHTNKNLFTIYLSVTYFFSIKNLPINITLTNSIRTASPEDIGFYWLNQKIKETSLTKTHTHHTSVRIPEKHWEIF